MAYSYTPIVNENSIRLLHLEPGFDGTPLKASLFIHDLDGQFSYDALSYVWGTPGLNKSLSIDEQELHITHNLHTILRHLRYPDRVRTLWIDAICINQQDHTEKGPQVALMGLIYRQADTVLCWLGELSTHRLWALQFLHLLAEEASRYLEQPENAHWAITGDELKPGLGANRVIQDAVNAHVESVYESDWFTRLWIVQELSLARDPIFLCGIYEMRWNVLEQSTRLLLVCLRETLLPRSLRSFKDASDLVIARGRYYLHLESISSGSFVVEQDWAWRMGRLAWDLRNKNCADDRDRVYGLLSLIGTTDLWKMVCMDSSFTPDYNKSVEWAYYQFWRRFGGYTSLFYAGLSRRQDHTKRKVKGAIYRDTSAHFTEYHLPSWAPDLREHKNMWKPVFDRGYETSSIVHHYMVVSVPGPPGILFVRGHRFDFITFRIYVNQPIKGSLEALHRLRNIIKFLLALESTFEVHSIGQSWVEALGSTLLMEMPVRGDHPFQRWLRTRKINTTLSDSKLQRIWKVYRDRFLANTGDIWVMNCSAYSSQTHPKLLVEGDDDNQLAYVLHLFLIDVLETHSLILTQQGYVGLAPPDIAVGDVVVAFGGEGTPFVVHDMSSDFVFGRVIRGESRVELVRDKIERCLSQVLGPCYVQGIMKGELTKDEEYSKQFEWEKDQYGMSPKPTLCLV